MDTKQLTQAILLFMDKVNKQGIITNERDEQHLIRLKALFKEITGKEFAFGEVDKTPIKAP